MKSKGKGPGLDMGMGMGMGEWLASGIGIGKTNLGLRADSISSANNSAVQCSAAQFSSGAQGSAKGQRSEVNRCNHRSDRLEPFRGSFEGPYP